MKKKSTFIVLFLSLLIILSSFATFFTYNSYNKLLERQGVALYDRLSSNYNLEQFILTTLYDYNPEDLVTIEGLAISTREANSILKEQYYRNSIYHFSMGLGYRTTLKGQDIYHQDDIFKGDMSLHLMISFDENGKARVEDLLKEHDTRSIDLKDAIFDTLLLNDLSLDKSELKLNPDVIDGYTVEIAARYPYDHSYANFEESASGYNFPSVIASAIFSALGIALITFIFILIYPYEVTKEISPFKYIKNIKVIFLLAFYALCIILLFYGFMLYDYYLVEEFIRRFIWGDGSIILTSAVYILAFMFTGLIGAMMGFSFKTPFIIGLGTYLKENTFIGTFLKLYHHILTALASLDLSINRDKKLLSFLGINIAIMALIYIMPYSFFFFIIYALALFFYVRSKLIKTQSDFAIVKSKLNELSIGNFNVPLEDVGIFTSLNETIQNIKTGFKKAVDDELRSQNMKNELISNVSHDLKTPLTCIKNYLTLLEDENLDEKTRKEYLNEIKRYTERLNRLVLDIFDVSKANTGNIELNVQTIDLKALIDQSVEENYDDLLSKNLMVIKKYPEEAKIALDPDKTYRIFDNLLNNIAKYALANSRVYIDLKSEDDTYICTIKNISEVEMNFTSEEVTERFFRGDKSRSKTGSGIGLAIVKSFIEAQGGKFTIEIDGDLFKTTLYFKNVESNA